MSPIRVLWFVLVNFSIAVPSMAFHAADPPVEEDLQWKIGQILINTIQNKEVDGGPSSELMKQFHAAGQNEIGPSWGHRDEFKSPIDSKPIQLYLSITVLPAEYKPTPEQEANWVKHRVSTDPESGAETAFIEQTKGGVRRHRVVHLLVKDGFRLFMSVSRTGDETVEEAVEKTRTGWTQFYDFAVKQGLFSDTGEGGLFLEVLDSLVTKGRRLESGEMLSFRYDHSKAVDVPIDVWAQAAHLENSKPYTLHFQFKPGRNRSGVTLTDTAGRPLRDTDGNGWYELPIGGPEQKSRIHVHLAATTAGRKKPGAVVLDQVGLGRMALIDDKDTITLSQDFGVQRRDWTPIVQTFHLVGRNWSPKLPPEEEAKLKDDEKSGIQPDDRISFNEYMTANGTLVQTYQTKIVPLATPHDMIGENDPVCLGWRPASRLNFLVAQNSPSDPQLPVVPQGVPMSLLIDVKIVEPPERHSAAFDSPDGLGGDFDNGPDSEVNANEYEAEIRRLIFVEDYEVIRTPIVQVDAGESENTFLQSLPKRLRQAPNRTDAAIVPGFALRRDASRLDDNFRLEVRDKEPHAVNESTIFSRVPGVYELRLKLNVYHSEEGPDHARPFDHAIRYAVAPRTFKVQVLEFRTQTLSK